MLILYIRKHEIEGQITMSTSDNGPWKSTTAKIKRYAISKSEYKSEFRQVSNSEYIQLSPR
jgi:hypothetical protein